MSPYAELHAHSNFSFLEGASHIEERARELGYEGLTLGVSSVCRLQPYWNADGG